ncbi:MAG TPA: polyphenol oxidase family protein [bacterium]|nr:polyphenol oxidase family protein [bacterium]
MKQIYGFIKDIDVKAEFDRIRNELSAKYGILELHILKQIHSDMIFVDKGGTGDGIIVTKPFTGALVRTADCFGVALIDRKMNISGIFHSGWRGTELKITVKGVQMMKDLKCSDIEAVIFPGIEKCCFEIGSELVGRFKNAGIPVEMKNGKYFADLKTSIIEGLKAQGVENIKDMSECTFCGKGFFSFRRDGTEKRHGAFVINFS